MKTWGIVFGLTGLLITMVIVFFLLRNELKFATQNGEGENSSQAPITQAQKAKATTELQSVKSSLTVYYAVKSKYPVLSSYSQMISELIKAKIMDVKPGEPEENFYYKYCSSNGTNYKLEANYNDETIFNEGADNCQPGE